MKFTQFKFPNGHRVPERIDRPEEIEKMAHELWQSGWSFEIEINPDTQIVHMDCCDEDEALANRLCRNGPAVPDKVDELVRESHAVFVNRNRPKAVGFRAAICDMPELYDSTKELR
jgi:hypothetical protein